MELNLKQETFGFDKGTIKYGREINKKPGNSKFILCVCKCGNTRWVQYKESSFKPPANPDRLCKECFDKEPHTWNNEVSNNVRYR